MEDCFHCSVRTSLLQHGVPRLLLTTAMIFTTGCATWAQNSASATQSPASTDFVSFLPLLILISLIAYAVFRATRKARLEDRYRDKRFRDLSWASLGSFLVVWIICYGLAIVLPTGVLIALGPSEPNLLLAVPILWIGAGFIIGTVGFSRFIIRVLPLHADKTRRVGAIRLLLALAVVVLLLLIVSGTTEIKANVGWLLVLLSLFVTLWWHSRPLSTLARPYVLYFRRFSSFSEYAVTAEVLRGTPRGARIVSLIGSAKDRRSWDPFLVSFTGIKMLRPFASSPIYLNSSDADWKKNVRELIHKARHVVIDVTDASEAIKEEIALSRELKEDDEIIWLADDAKLESNLPMKLSDRCIRYSKSWVRALSRMFFGYLLTFIGTIYLVAQDRVINLIQVFIMGEFRIGFDAVVVYLEIYGLLALILWIPLFCKPVVSYRSAKEIRQMLR